MSCKFCGKETCYEHCEESKSGTHQPDMTTARAADETRPDDQKVIIDITCQRCGVSGSAEIRREDIQWG